MHIVRIWIHNYQFELVVGLGSNLDPGCNLRNVRERFLVFRQLLKLLERIQLPESIEKSQNVKHCHVSIRHLVHTKCWRQIHVSTGVADKIIITSFPTKKSPSIIFSRFANIGGSFSSQTTFDVLSWNSYIDFIKQTIYWIDISHNHETDCTLSAKSWTLKQVLIAMSPVLTQ